MNINENITVATLFEIIFYSDKGNVIVKYTYKFFNSIIKSQRKK